MPAKNPDWRKGPRQHRIEYTCLRCGKKFMYLASRPRQYCSIQCSNNKKSLEQRFWENVRKTDNCWIWTSPAKAGRGYGNISSKNATRLTHRVSWEMHYGPIPNGLCVLHHCDNPACVRPDHLFLGTIADNQADKEAKGRHRGWTKNPKSIARGSQNGNSQLNEVQVQKMLQLRKSGVGQSKVASMYGISDTCLRNIERGFTWKHVPREG